MKLSFHNNFKQKIPKILFEKKIKAFEKVFNLKPALTLNLIILSDVEMKKLNKNYRKIDKPTDVLSFSYFQKKTAGEIFISLEAATRQAKIKRHSLNKELEILFVHGLLHVFGFDHRNDEEEKEMETWAKKIFRA